MYLNENRIRESGRRRPFERKIRRGGFKDYKLAVFMPSGKFSKSGRQKRIHLIFERDPAAHKPEFQD